MSSIVLGPLIGRMRDEVGKYGMFCYASGGAILVVQFYTTLSNAPFWLMVLISVVMFTTITGRMSSAGALTSAVPAPPSGLV